MQVFALQKARERERERERVGERERVLVLLASGILLNAITTRPN